NRQACQLSVARKQHADLSPERVGQRAVLPPQSRLGCVTRPDLAPAQVALAEFGEDGGQQGGPVDAVRAAPLERRRRGDGKVMLAAKHVAADAHDDRLATLFREYAG